MIPIIVACLYGALAAVVFIQMVNTTNKRLDVSHLNDMEDTKIIPYTRGTALWTIFAIIVAVSIVAGYIVATKAVSIIAIIELSICYFAVLAAAIIDFKTKTIPNIIPISLVVGRILIFVYELIYANSAISYFVSSLVGAFLCMLLLIIANKISKGGIGGGDIKLIASIGFVCGVYVVISSMLLALICCIVVSSLLLALKKCSTKDNVPFGPFIYVGYLIMCLLTLY